MWYFRDELVEAFNIAIEAIKDVLNWFGRLISGAIDAAKDVVSGVTDWFTDLVSDAATWGVDFIKNFAGSIRDGISDIVSVFGDMARDAASWFIDRFNSVVPNSITIPGATLSVPAVLGGGSVSVGPWGIDIPQLDVGGDILSDGLAMLHAGETVVPADVDTGFDESNNGDTPAFGAGQTQNIQVLLDGRRVDEGIRRHRDEDTSVRGRFG